MSLATGGSWLQKLKQVIVNAINSSQIGANNDGYRYIYVYGELPTFNTNSVSDIVSYGTISYLPSTAGTITIRTATLQNDSVGGTGAHEITVVGLTDDLTEIAQTVNMSGTTLVTLPINLRRVNDAFTGECGSAGTNVDNINIYHNGTQISQIQSGHGRGQNATYTIPKGYAGQIIEYWASVADDQAGQNADLHLQYRSGQNQSWQVHIDNVVLNPVTHLLKGIYVDEGYDIVVRARDASSNGMHLFASFTLELYRK